MIFEPLELIEKLAALVPPPRFNLVRYHGILAPAAAYRSLVVPESETSETASHPDCAAAAHTTSRVADGEKAAKKGRSRPRNHPWAELLRRVFSIDVLACPRCGARMRILCAINPPEAIRKILACLGLPSRPPPIAPAAPYTDDVCF